MTSISVCHILCLFLYVRKKHTAKIAEINVHTTTISENNGNLSEIVLSILSVIVG